MDRADAGKSVAIQAALLRPASLADPVGRVILSPAHPTRVLLRGGLLKSCWLLLVILPPPGGKWLNASWLAR